MSVEALTWAKKVRTGDSGAKLVLMILADYANHDLVAWPSHQTLADTTELSVRSVIRKLEILEERGLIERVHRYREDGSPTSNQYFLQVEGVVTEGQGVVTHRQGGSVRLSPKPSIEPPEETNMSQTADVEPADKEAKKKETPQFRNSYPDWFEKLWSAYPQMIKGRSNPKRGGYLKAKGWLNKGYTEADLIAAAVGYANSKPNPQYVQMTQTFFGPSAAFEQYIDSGQVDSGKQRGDITDVHKRGRVIEPEELIDEGLFA